ncbi:hypothetical protein E5676_scaffold255G004480 [Cucumis melo var. makuwa]|uniref:Uncharacterized protein n=2 Tax=Cucumis melo TaxID=3656 RepID=A0A5D3CR30_CUCMM|nr:hypothetical protein E5676_scaffold255G004480 [Cucumis melo var. makuwa]
MLKTEMPNLNSPAMPNYRISSFLLIILLMAAPRFFLSVDCRPLRPGSPIDRHHVHNASAIPHDGPETQKAATALIDSGGRRIGDEGGGVAFTMASGPSRKGAGH